MKVIPIRSKMKPPPLYPTVVVSGYYGFDNLGDELILQVLITALKKKSANIIVLSQTPEVTRLRYDVEAIQRNNIIKIIKSLSKANLFVSGGGGLFQDVTSLKSPLYYGGIIHLASFLKVPVCFWAQGVGPVSHKISQAILRSTIKRCSAVTVRDEKSADLLQAITHTQPEVSSDPVWLLDIDTLLKERQKPEKKSEWTIGISLRSWPDLTEDRLLHLSNLLEQLAEQKQLEGRSLELLLLPFQTEEDTELLQQIAKQLSQSKENISIKKIPADKVLSQIACCDALLGMRFHSIVLALLFNLPVFGLSYDPKVETLLKQFSLSGERIENIEHVTAEKLAQALSTPLKADLTSTQEKASRNIQIIEEFLSIPQAELAL